MLTLNNAQFEHDFRLNITDPSGGSLPGVHQARLGDNSLELQAKLDVEFTQLSEDRHLLRSRIFPVTAVRWYLHVNLQRTVQNAIQIFCMTYS